MDVEAVDLAVGARVEEVLEPGKTHWIGTISDSWSAELGLALEWVHVLSVGSGGSCVAQVGLCSEIWLVEGEEVSRAGSDGRLGILAPRVNKVGSCAPKCWDECEVAAQTAAG